MRHEMYNPDKAEWEELLVGHRIISAQLTGIGEDADAVLVLDNGRRFRVRGNEGCGGCSNGYYWVTHVATVDNIITAVTLEATEVQGGINSWGEEAWIYRVFVVVDGLPMEILTVEGDDGNGYYGTGYYLELMED